VKLEYIIVIVI